MNPKNLLTIFKNRIQYSYTKSDSDSETKGFKLNALNDFTSNIIRKEKTEFEDSDTLSLVGVCPSKHGGLLDYPKIVTESSGLVVDKWDVCYNLVMEPVQINGDVVNRDRDGDDGDDRAEAPSPTEEFISSVSESATKLILHHAWLTEVLVKAGDIEKLTGVAGGLALVRNKLWQYNEMVDKQLTSLYKEACELVECLCEQMTLYYSNTLTTMVMVDSDSQDWEDVKSFHEGDRISYCIQMWWYVMESSRQYLWSSLPPNMSSNIFLSVLNQTLAVLVHRYSSLQITGSRVNQYRGDLVTILLAVAHLLPCFTPDMESLTRGPTRDSPDQVHVSSIYAKCEHLLSMLVMVTAPPSQLLTSLKQPRKVPAKDKHKKWNQLIYPQLYNPAGDNMARTHLYLVSRLISDHPHPSWALMCQLCTSANYMFTKILLTQMGAFVPSVDTSGHVTRCGSLQCGDHGTTCLGSATSFWPVQVVQGALLPVVYSNTESVIALVTCLEPLLTKLTRASWECLHLSNVWNMRKPVWLSALVNILEPYLAPAVEDMLQGVEDGRTWTLKHVVPAKQMLVDNMVILVETIPVPVLGSLLYIRSTVPDTVVPLANSVVAQILISTVYQAIFSLIPILKQLRLQKEKIDFLLALCESLCNDKDSVDLTVLDSTVVSCLDINSLTEIESMSSSVSFNMTAVESVLEEPVNDNLDKYEVTAFDVLKTDANKLAFMGLYRWVNFVYVHHKNV